jgi:hypothetical protein
VVLQERSRASERLVWRLVGQHCRTQRHSGKVVSIEEAMLRKRIRPIAAEQFRLGCRMVHRLLRREDWNVNHKRLQRLFQAEEPQWPSPHIEEAGTTRRRIGEAPQG